MQQKSTTVWCMWGLVEDLNQSFNFSRRSTSTVPLPLTGTNISRFVYVLHQLKTSINRHVLILQFSVGCLSVAKRVICFKAEADVRPLAQQRHSLEFWEDPHRPERPSLHEVRTSILARDDRPSHWRAHQQAEEFWDVQHSLPGWQVSSATTLTDYKAVTHSSKWSEWVQGELTRHYDGWSTNLKGRRVRKGYEASTCPCDGLFPAVHSTPSFVCSGFADVLVVVEALLMFSLATAVIYSGIFGEVYISNFSFTNAIFIISSWWKKKKPEEKKR